MRCMSEGDGGGGGGSSGAIDRQENRVGNWPTSKWAESRDSIGDYPYMASRTSPD
jgi:hypothetical protein